MAELVLGDAAPRVLDLDDDVTGAPVGLDDDQDLSLSQGTCKGGGGDLGIELHDSTTGSNLGRTQARWVHVSSQPEKRPEPPRLFQGHLVCELEGVPNQV